MLGDGIHAAREGLLLFLRARHGDVHRAARLFGRARAHHRGRSVVHRPVFTRHDLGEDAVHRVQNGGAGAEIGVQRQRAPLCGEALELLREKCGRTAAEPVDGLFRVPDHEHVFARNKGEDALLHGVHVLILVHKDVRVPARDFRAHLRVFQKREALVLEVGKVQRARAALFLGVRLRKGEHRAAQRGGDPARGIEFFALLLRARPSL